MNKKQVSLKMLNSQLALKILAIGLISISSQIYAQDTIKTQNLNEVVISASRSEQLLDETGRSVSIIGPEKIKNSVYSTVAELLSEQEGIFITGTGQTPGSLQSIYMRGANSEHTIILIDGVRITDPSSVDNAINLAELSLINVQKIEIVRGSHSTLYGSSAIGGVVNIITKSLGNKGINGTVDLQGGTFGKSTSELIENITLNYTSKNGFYVNGEFFNTNVKGLDATTDTVTNPNVFKNRDKDGFTKTDFSGKIGFKNNKWDVFASYKLTEQKLDIDDGAYTDDDNYTVDFNRNLISYHAGYKVNDNLSIKFLGGYTDMSRLSVDDSSRVDQAGNFDHAYSETNYEGTVNNNELQLNLKLKNLSLVAGAGNYGESMTTKTYYINTAWAYVSESDLDTLNLKTNMVNVFAHLDLNGSLLSENLNQFNLALGVRFTNHSTFGNFMTYEINPSYKLNEKSILFAAVSTGFNAPAMYRLYSPNQNYSSQISRGNINLEPETSSSYELGIKHQIGKSTYFTLSIFRTVVNNLIEYVYLWDKNIPIETLGNDWMRDDYRGDTYLNIGTQTNRGFEFGIQSKLNEKWSLNGHVSLVSGKLNYKPENTDMTNDYHLQIFATGDFLTSEIKKEGLARRANTAFVNLHYQASKKLKLAADLRYVGSKNDIYYNSSQGPYGSLGQIKVGDYTLAGISAKYQISENLRGMLKVNNLFNTKYQEINGFNTRGRGFYLKLNYTF